MNNNSKKIFVEVRSAAGGDEARIWATDLMRMYMRYATKKGFKVSPVDDITISIKGSNLFKLLKNESGVHRVQRVPATEKRGRLHTSTATVAILPEIEEKEIEIKPTDLNWQFYRASTQGGQNVQKVSTAVRLAHRPSKIVVTSEQERYQEQNRNIALELLRAKLWEKQQEEKSEKVATYRSAIGRGMRAEKIRTYNYPQNRVTDHRVNKSWGNLEAILDGYLDKILRATKNIKK